MALQILVIRMSVLFNTHQEPEALYQQLYLMAIEEITGRVSTAVGT